MRGLLFSLFLLLPLWAAAQAIGDPVPIELDRKVVMDWSAWQTGRLEWLHGRKPGSYSFLQIEHRAFLPGADVGDDKRLHTAGRLGRHWQQGEHWAVGASLRYADRPGDTWRTLGGYVQHLGWLNRVLIQQHLELEHIDTDSDFSSGLRLNGSLALGYPFRVAGAQFQLQGSGQLYRLFLYSEPFEGYEQPAVDMVRLRALLLWQALPSLAVGLHATRQIEYYTTQFGSVSGSLRLVYPQVGLLVVLRRGVQPGQQVRSMLLPSHY